MALDPKKSKLSKLKMPDQSNAPEMDMSDLNADDGQDSGDGQSDTNPDDNTGDHQGNDQISAELEKLSDDDLLAEVKKRGLMRDLNSEPSGDAEPLA